MKNNRVIFKKDDTYILFKGCIYKLIKITNKKIIILNVDTLLLYVIKWGPFCACLWFRTLDEARTNSKIYNNYYNLNNLKFNYDSEDIFNYDMKEPLKLLQPTNQENIKQYKKLGLLCETTYKICYV
jgi:hypothetical protein